MTRISGYTHSTIGEDGKIVRSHHEDFTDNMGTRTKRISELTNEERHQLMIKGHKPGIVTESQRTVIDVLTNATTEELTDAMDDISYEQVIRLFLIAEARINRV